MAFVKNLFDKNFLEYASYVIRDRAIPDLEDGLKPVQRRIMHTLFEIDDGKFHKVANVVGQCMKYHPHGDASIGGALVVLANKDIFIDKQGNFGNIYTGDSASAPRYIECRCTPLSKDILYNPAITKFNPSYDGRGKEPVAFRAKLPMVLIMGAEGIAVGMSTKIMSHNIREVIDAEKKCLMGEKFKLYPDFPTGGLLDVTDYDDGLGKIITRAKLDTSDPKRIVVTELPFGSSTESLIASIENAAKSGKVKISSISDFTTDKVEIEIKLQRGIYSEEVVDALYAFTDCEQSISCNLLVINNNQPQVMTVTDVIKAHAKQLTQVLKDELELERANLNDKLHLRTLERIFIEERIYKRIETIKTADGVVKAVITGFEPFKAELLREITEEDVEHLLRIPIRRISLYDINKNRQEVEDIKARLKEIAKLLKNLRDYAISYLDSVLAKLDKTLTERKTKITNIETVDVREVVKRDTALRYDASTGYLGTAVATGTEIMKVTPFDRILILRKSGVYIVCDVPEKLFVDTGMWYCGLADKEELSKVLFTVIYRDPKTKYAYIKRCRIEQFIMNRDYMIVPDGMQIAHIDTREKFSFVLKYAPKPRLKILEEKFKAGDFEEKGVKAQGVRLAVKEVKGLTLEKDTKKVKKEADPVEEKQDDMPLFHQDEEKKTPKGKAAVKEAVRDSSRTKRSSSKTDKIPEAKKADTSKVSAASKNSGPSVKKETVKAAAEPAKKQNKTPPASAKKTEGKAKVKAAVKKTSSSASNTASKQKLKKPAPQTKAGNKPVEKKTVKTDKKPGKK
ncbi:MAG TPA: DNA topoisomerase IV subunit A [Treponemataceae bacterium]|nr:DNA topoisomerase IV subunit A [Treponemataceae bacterium]